MYFNRRYTPPRPRKYAIRVKREGDIAKMEKMGIILEGLSRIEGYIDCSALLDSEQRAQVSKFGEITPL